MKKVVLHMRDGMIRDAEVPAGVEVEVRDYDISSIEPEAIEDVPPFHGNDRAMVYNFKGEPIG